MTPELRNKLEQTIDRLISVLDAIDAPDEDREPSLGWISDGQLAYGLGDDQEEQCEDEGADEGSGGIGMEDPEYEDSWQQATLNYDDGGYTQCFDGRGREVGTDIVRRVVRR